MKPILDALSLAVVALALLVIFLRAATLAVRRYREFRAQVVAHLKDQHDHDAHGADHVCAFCDATWPQRPDDPTWPKERAQ